MGVAGVGKTTVGRIIADELGWPFHDADDFHSPANVATMTGGTALTEADREPWLHALQDLVRGIDARGESAVLACSALAWSFRARLSSAAGNVVFVHLRDTAERLHDRLEKREGHYMKADMLDSQLQTLEEPADALLIDVGADGPDAVAARILRALDL